MRRATLFYNSFFGWTFVFCCPMKQHVTYYVSRVKMKPETKQRLSTVMTVAKTTFRWGFIPLVLYLGNISYGPSFFFV